MIEISSDSKIFIYRDSIDLRKSIDGLVLLIVEELARDPQDKAMYIFHNKSKDKIKAIYWDKDGFILLYKRLEKARFKFPKDITTEVYELDVELFNWLKRGFDFYLLQENPELKKSKYF